MLRGRAGCGLCRCGLGFGGLLQRELAVDLELDLLADQESTATEGNVPGEAPVTAVDGSGERAADLGVAERVDDRAAVLVIEGDLFGHAFDGQVAGHLVVVAVTLDRLEREHDFRGVLDIQEVGALQVAVALLRAGRDARGLNGDGAASGRRVVRVVQFQVSGDLAEAATNGRDAKVLRAEGDRRVMRVKTPRHSVYSLQARRAPGGLGLQCIRYPTS